MNYNKIGWTIGGVIVASVLDLVYMFWSRSPSGSKFNKAVWNSSGMGRGNFSIMDAAKYISKKVK